MLIPVKCFTCGEVLGNKYSFYQSQVRMKKFEQNVDMNNVLYLTEENKSKTPEGEVLDMLNLNKMCCRRHMLTHVDIE